MLNKILMPSGGQTTDELLILQWNKQIGDPVKRGDILFEIETDKAILTVESFAEGTLLEINYEAGATVKAGETVALVGEAGETALAKEADETVALVVEAGPTALVKESVEMVAAADTSAPKSKPMYPQNHAAQREERIHASPLAKSRARSENIKLEDVARYVSKNLIKKDDISAYLAHIGNGSVAQDFYFIDATPMRKTIARRMKESRAIAPHYTVSIDVDMTRMVALRNKLNKSLAEKGITISYNDLLMKVSARAIASHPHINAAYQDDRVKIYHDVHIGLAVAIEGGLVVPVIREVNKKSLLEIATASAQCIEKVKSGRINESDITGGTLTLSNLGGYGMKAFTAIINQPESCILAIGAILEKPVSVNRVLKIRDVMNITASFDHRVIDGAVGAAFLQEVKYLLENPHMLVL